jgi:hypothetical protein
MLDLFGNASNQRQFSGITEHQIAVNKVLAIRYEAGRAHYVGDEFRINRCRAQKPRIWMQRRPAHSHRGCPLSGGAAQRLVVIDAMDREQSLDPVASARPRACGRYFKRFDWCRSIQGGLGRGVAV